jgi:AcrR family transcriptional regulator
MMGKHIDVAKSTKPVSEKSPRNLPSPKTKTSVRGRPARLSSDKILATSVKLLDQMHYPFDEFTLSRVAEELDTVSMALYNYYPSRGALLGAVADHICMQFRMPKTKPGQSWQKTLYQWLRGFHSLAKKNPIVFQLMGYDGKMSAGWLRITTTVTRTLHEQGMDGKELALNTWLFCTKAIALVQTEVLYSSFRTPIALSHLDELNAEEQETVLMLRRYAEPITSEEALEEGFKEIIATIELKLAKKHGHVSSTLPG